MYASFFDTAEERRRWNVRHDIPWDATPGAAVDPELAEVLVAFYATEMFLPDYTSKLLALNRDNQGLAWFLTNWGYEESKHSLAIEEWLLRSGHRSPDDMETLNASLLRNEWMLPFETSRQMLVYTVFQERATQLNYLNLAKASADAEDPALAKLLRLIAGDEGVHHGHFVACVRHHLELDRAGTLRDIGFVLANFRMPISEEIPGWERHQDLVRKHGIYSDRMFVTSVMLPSIKKLRVDRAELRAHRR